MTSAEYDDLAAEFYAETGLIAPGKDVPAAWWQDEDEARAKWTAWLKKRNATDEANRG